MDTIIEEIESLLPVFITIDPSYRSIFNPFHKDYQPILSESKKHSEDYRQYLKIFDSKN